MGVERWRRMLVLTIVLVAGCRLTAPTTAMPASFMEQMQASNLVFQVVNRPAGAMSDAGLVAALRADASTPMLLARAVPVFGALSCIDTSAACEPGPAGFLGGQTRDVWVVVYPDWVGPDGDVGWVVVDAATGLQFGFAFNDPRIGD